MFLSVTTPPLEEECVVQKVKVKKWNDSTQLIYCYYNKHPNRRGL